MPRRANRTPASSRFCLTDAKAPSSPPTNVPPPQTPAKEAHPRVLPTTRNDREGIFCSRSSLHLPISSETVEAERATARARFVPNARTVTAESAWTAEDESRSAKRSSSKMLASTRGIGNGQGGSGPGGLTRNPKNSLGLGRHGKTAWLHGLSVAITTSTASAASSPPCLDRCGRCRS